MPRYLPSLLAGVVFFVLLFRAVVGVRELAGKPEAEFVGPGEYHFAVATAGDFTVWHKATASIDGVYVVRESRLPAGTEIAVTHGGAVVPTRPNGGSTVSGTERGEQISVLSFKASEPGEYLIKVSGFEEKHAFSVAEGIGLSPFLAVLSWCGLAVCAGAVFVTFVVLAVLKVFPKKAASDRTLNV